MNTRFTDQINRLLSQYQIIENKARKSFFVQLIFGLIKSRNVQYNKIASAIKMSTGQPKLKSIIHRTEDFFREVKPNKEALALLLLSFLNPKKKLRVCIDRTEWDFGLKQLNILMIIVCDGTHYVPVSWIF